MDRAKTNIGFLGPQKYMEKAIGGLRENYNVTELHPNGWEEDEIAKVVQVCKEKNIEVVCGFAQKDALHHVLINVSLGNVTVSKIALLYCMNKYLMRTCESNPFWFDYIDPAKETEEEIIGKIREWPFMLKISSLTLGKFIFKVENREDLKRRLIEYNEAEDMQKEISLQNEKIFEGIERKDLPPIIPPLIAEHMVDVNNFIEFCYDGYVTIDGKVRHYAMTEEVYFDNHQAIGYLTPPVNLSAKNASQIEAYMDDFMSRIVSIGFRNQFFNIEFWVEKGNEDNIILVEINPRASYPFQYNIMFAFGNSLYSDNFELARDGTEPVTTPWTKWKSGEINCYTMNSLITTKESGKVEDILDYDYIKHLETVEKLLVGYTRRKNEIIKESDVTATGVPTS